jgi:hypothetical protein
MLITCNPTRTLQPMERRSRLVARSTIIPIGFCGMGWLVGSRRSRRGWDGWMDWVG